MSPAPELPVSFFNISGHPLPVQEKELITLFKAICVGEKAEFSVLETVFTDEAEIQRINQEFLKREYITDTISFRYNQESGNTNIEGTHYLCVPRILEQAGELKVDEAQEMKRVFIHGILHIIGYEDSDDASRKQMHKREDHYLGL